MKMDNNIENKVVSWMMLKKLKGFEFFDFFKCAREMGLDSNDKYHIKKIDAGVEKYKNLNQFVINFFEENS